MQTDSRSAARGLNRAILLIERIAGALLGAVTILIVASAIGVLAGSAISHYVSEKQLSYVAGLGFIGIGIWTLIKA